MQQEMALTGQIVLERRNLDWGLIECARTPQEAARICIRHSRSPMTQEQAADALKINRSHFCSMLSSSMKRKRHMPLDIQEDLQNLCGNNALNQWGELYRKRQLNHQRKPIDPVVALQIENAELKKQLEAKYG